MAQKRQAKIDANRALLRSLLDKFKGDPERAAEAFVRQNPGANSEKVLTAAHKLLMEERSALPTTPSPAATPGRTVSVANLEDIFKGGAPATPSITEDPASEFDTVAQRGALTRRIKNLATAMKKGGATQSAINEELGAIRSLVEGSRGPQDFQRAESALATIEEGLKGDFKAARQGAAAGLRSVDVPDPVSGRTVAEQVASEGAISAEEAAAQAERLARTKAFKPVSDSLETSMRALLKGAGKGIKFTLDPVAGPPRLLAAVAQQVKDIEVASPGTFGKDADQILDKLTAARNLITEAAASGEKLLPVEAADVLHQVESAIKGVGSVKSLPAKAALQLAVSRAVLDQAGKSSGEFAAVKLGEEGDEIRLHKRIMEMEETLKGQATADIPQPKVSTKGPLKLSSLLPENPQPPTNVPRPFAPNLSGIVGPTADVQVPPPATATAPAAPIAAGLGELKDAAGKALPGLRQPGKLLKFAGGGRQGAADLLSLVKGRAGLAGGARALLGTPAGLLALTLLPNLFPHPNPEDRQVRALEATLPTAAEKLAKARATEIQQQRAIQALAADPSIKDNVLGLLRQMDQLDADEGPIPGEVTF